MNTLRKHWHIPFSLLYKLWFGVCFAVSLLALYPVFKIFIKRKKYQTVFKLERAWAALLCAMAFIRVRVDQQAPLPPPPYLIVANHASYLDTVFLLRVFKQPFLFLGKAELLRWPLFRIFFYDMNIAVARGSAAKSLTAFTRASEALKKGWCVAIFPEGGIPDSAPKMAPFKKGALRLAQECNVPIVPVTFCNSYRRFGEPSCITTRALPGTARAVIHPYVNAQAVCQADLLHLRQNLHTTIQAALLHAS